MRAPVKLGPQDGEVVMSFGMDKGHPLRLGGDANAVARQQAEATTPLESVR